MENILKNLNPKQKQAVKFTEGPVLILSGPGSGKTRCITHRLAYLIKKGISSNNILAVTFTNKAANEMRTRVAKLLATNNLPFTPLDTTRLTGFIGTFHAFCLRILRKEIDKLNYKKTFIIYDEKDQLNLIKQVIKNLDINQEQFQPKKIAATISALKSELIEYQTYKKNAQEYFEKTISKLYQKYQEELKKNNALDFDDLIMLCVKVFEKFPKILEKYQKKFKYILVDEYQDTNPAQYRLIKLLSQKYKNLCVVGDESQAIYGFRNADFRNILNFEKDFPKAKVITLDQNYRSSQTILDAASKLISKNIYQKPKSLWTENPLGPPLSIIQTRDEKTEAELIIAKILELSKQGYKLNDFTVFYRINAQSRALEEAFIRHNIPYKLIGAIKFYQRKEIKDVLAYLKLIVHPNDSVSLERVKKIGKPRTRTSSVRGKTPFEILKLILEKIKYREYLKDEDRWENVKELFTIIKDYDNLERFLESTALLSEADEVEEQKELVHLMTLHTAKGLEFPAVFIIGCEEGILPHSRSLFNPLDLEEERRLFYVGITRSKKHVYLVFSQTRANWGNKQANPASRFLTEIPEELIKFEQHDKEIDDIDF